MSDIVVFKSTYDFPELLDELKSVIRDANGQEILERLDSECRLASHHIAFDESHLTDLRKKIRDFENRIGELDQMSDLLFAGEQLKEGFIKFANTHLRDKRPDFYALVTGVSRWNKVAKDVGYKFIGTPDSIAEVDIERSYMLTFDERQKIERNDKNYRIEKWRRTFAIAAVLGYGFHLIFLTLERL